MEIANFLRIPRDENGFIRHDYDGGIDVSRQYRHARHHNPTTIPPHSAATLPEALPCRHFARHIPHRTEALGNVHITDEAELCRWKLVARRVTREEADKHGGCIIFTPTPSSKGSSLGVGEKEYYCITDTDDTVYGRAAYRTRATTATNVLIYHGHRVVR